MKTAKDRYTLIVQSEILIEQSPLIEHSCVRNLYNYFAYALTSYPYKVKIFTTSIIIIVNAAPFVKFDCGF